MKKFLLFFIGIFNFILMPAQLNSTLFEKFQSNGKISYKQIIDQNKKIKNNFNYEFVKNQKDNSKIIKNCKDTTDVPNAIILVGDKYYTFPINDPSNLTYTGINTNSYYDLSMTKFQNDYYGGNGSGLFKLNFDLNIQEYIVDGNFAGPVFSNPITNTLYGASIGDNISISEIDHLTGETTFVNASSVYLSNFILNAIYSNDGKIYVIDTYPPASISELDINTMEVIEYYEIDEEICYIDMFALQDLEFDYFTNSLYIVGFNFNIYSSVLYKFDLNTKQMSVLGNFPSGQICGQLAIDNDFSKLAVLDGYVKESGNENPIDNAKIKIGEFFETNTDENGYFSIALPKREYSNIETNSEGYYTETIDNFILNSDETLNIYLEKDNDYVFPSAIVFKNNTSIFSFKLNDINNLTSVAENLLSGAYNNIICGDYYNGLYYFINRIEDENSLFSFNLKTNQLTQIVGDTIPDLISYNPIDDHLYGVFTTNNKQNIYKLEILNNQLESTYLNFTEFDYCKPEGFVITNEGRFIFITYNSNNWEKKLYELNLNDFESTLIKEIKGDAFNNCYKNLFVNRVTNDIYLITNNFYKQKQCLYKMSLDPYNLEFIDSFNQYGSLFSSCIFTQDFYCYPINNLIGIFENENVYLSWENNYVNNLLDYSYNVYRDSEFIGNTDSLFFVDENISQGTYNYCVEVVCGDICTSEQVCTEVIVKPTCYEVNNLIANVEEHNVTLSWTIEENNSNNEEVELSWSGPYENIGIGFNSPNDFDVAHRFEVSDLTNYIGWTLTKVTFYPFESYCDYSIRAWTGENAATLVLDQPVYNPVIQGRTVVDVETNVTIEAGKEFWIGYRCNTYQGYPAGIDAGPAVQGKGDMLHYLNNNNEMLWTSLFSLGIDNNIVIIGTIVDSKGNVANLTLNDVTSRYVEGSRSLVSISENQPKSVSGLLFSENIERNDIEDDIVFNIYRDGELIGNTTDYTFFDEGLEEGTYNYCVEVVYQDCDLNQTCVDAIIESIQCNPVRDLNAEVDENVVVLSWNYPEGFNEEPPIEEVELSWSSDFGNQAIGFGGGAADFDVAHRYARSDLTDYIGWHLKKVAFYPCEINCEYYVKAWIGYNQNELSLVLNQEVTDLNIENETVVYVNDDVVIEAEKEFWVGYRCNTQEGWPAGTDIGPCVTGKGDLFYSYDQSGWNWHTLGASNLPVNFCIVATIANEEGKVVNLKINEDSRNILNESATQPISLYNFNNKVNHKSEKALGTLIGYNIFRDNQLIATINDINTLEYQDNYLLKDNILNYCVQAIYEECESELACIDVEIIEEIICNPVQNLVADVVNDVVTLTWDEPVAKGREVILSEGFESGDIPSDWTQIDADGDGNIWYTYTAGHEGTYCATSDSFINFVGPQTPDNYLITPELNLANGGTLTFWVCAQDALYPAEHYGVYASTTGNSVEDFGNDALLEETLTAKHVGPKGPRGTNDMGTWYQRTVELPSGTKYVAFRHFNCTDQFRLNLDDIEITGEGGGSDDPVSDFTFNVYKDGVLLGTTQELTYQDANLAQGTYNYCVEVVCDENTTSNQVCVEATVEGGSDCNPITNLVADVVNDVVTLTWDEPVTKGRDVILSEGFESGDIPSDWTQIDADGDGNIWYTYTAGHEGTYCATSDSYINYVGAQTPDNYLITPELNLTNGGTLTFWVCAQDALYPAEHYGVYASTTGNSVEDFGNNALLEETLTAKHVGPKGPRGTNDMGTWYQRTVELPSGTKYVAFRHFNCTDQFRLNLDDIEITGEGGGSDDPVSDFTFNVYKDGVLLGTTQELTYEDTVLEVGTYNYCVEVVCDENLLSDQVCVEVEVEEIADDICNPVRNLEGVNVDNSNVIELTWDKPSTENDDDDDDDDPDDPTGEEVELTWSGAYDNNAVGFNGPADFDVAHRYEVSDLTEYVGWKLTKITFYPYEANCEYSLRAWTGSNAANLVLDQVVSNPVIQGATEVTVDTDVTILANEEFYIGYRCNAQEGWPAGIDAGPAVVGKGDLLHYEDENGNMIWEGMSSMGLDYNFVIVGTIANSKGETANLTLNDVSNRRVNGELSVTNNLRNNNRSLLGYNIYLDNELIATIDDPNVTNFTDDFSHINSKDYSANYCVRAVYSTCESMLECVNVILYTTGIEDNANLSVYPNPANNIVNIDGVNVEKVYIYNNIGQLVEVLNTNQVDVSSYARGIYLFNIFTTNGAMFKVKVVLN